MKTFGLVHFCCFPVIALISSIYAQDDCMVSMCTSNFIQVMDDLVLRPTATQQYCKVLNIYIECLNQTQNECRSVLQFHSSKTAAAQNWRRFNCENISISTAEVGSEEECPTMFREDQRTVAFFGFSHVRLIDDTIESCDAVGTWPLVDNKFFVVQLTTNSVPGYDNRLTLLTQVTVMFRSNSLCSESRTYQTNLHDDVNLTTSFVDGTNFVGADDSPVLSVQLLNVSTVRLWAKFIATEIFVLRHFDRLAVVVNSPDKILISFQTDAPTHQLALTGCSWQRRDLNLALNRPFSYARCLYAGKPLVGKYEAYHRCQEDHVRGDLHSTCAFDLMFGRDSSAEYNETTTLMSWKATIGTMRHFNALRTRNTKTSGTNRSDRKPQCLNSTAERSSFVWIGCKLTTILLLMRLFG
ncbi:hypothetical protein M3Y94_00711200 [Aphelenchoides besseyi]|nr:hypothetical protein M3Y94_00711200 [Aphelenchoides besseyi]KAI6231712.1 RGM domain family member B [Aphelenchoides besseyi]